MIHAKKVAPEYFEALRSGAKRFELRREDPEEPSYAVGDYLAVNEYDPGRHAAQDDLYTGRCMLFEITYVLRDTEWLQPDCAALSLRALPLCMDDLNMYRQPGAGVPLQAVKNY